jgi:hypothetical protein
MNVGDTLAAPEQSGIRPWYDLGSLIDHGPGPWEN